MPEVENFFTMLPVHLQGIPVEEEWNREWHERYNEKEREHDDCSTDSPTVSWGLSRTVHVIDEIHPECGIHSEDKVEVSPESHCAHGEQKYGESEIHCVLQSYVLVQRTPN